MYPQWSLTAVGLGYIHPPYRTRPIQLGLQFPLQLFQPLLPYGRIGRYRADGLPVDSRRSVIALHKVQRMRQHLQACQLPIQAPEPVSRFGLGLTIKRALELPKLFRGCYLFRAISRSFAPLRRVRTSSVPCDPPKMGTGLGLKRPKIQPARILVTMNASDFQTDLRRLTSWTGLCGGLSLVWFLAHQSGPPRLSDACRTGVPTTLTPTEFAGLGDWLSCKQRPSHNTPEARRLRAFNITRLI